MVNRVPSFIYDMTVEAFEAEVAGLAQARFYKVPADANVDPYGLPRFNVAFDECCRIYGRIPTQVEYANYYITDAEDYLKENRLNVNGFSQRAARNYACYIREYQLFLLVKEAFPDGLVELDLEMDNRGVDIIVTEPNGVRFGICSFTDTMNGRAWSKAKDIARRWRIEFPLMDLAINIRNAKVINGYWLHDERHINQINEFLRATF